MDTNTAPGTIAVTMKPKYPFDPAKLIARRARIGKTQAEIAAAVGFAQPHYARIESGERPNPTLDTAVRIAKALGCLVEDLIVE